MAAGIGFFLAHIGYQAGEGIGLVVADPATLVTLGQAPATPAWTTKPEPSHSLSMSSVLQRASW